jgi:methanogenic corrinoid protein MtbC1/DNA-binding XRE family transcriptional regulator
VTADQTPSDARRARRFLSAAVTGDVSAARTVIVEALRAELSLARLYQDIFTPALEGVGRLWAAGRLTSAHEHLATQITLDQMARLRQQARPARRLGLLAVVSTVEGEQHWVGARMVADLLEEAGWSVDFLGPSTPVADLVAHVAARQMVDLVVVSATMEDHLPALGRLSAGLGALPTPPKLVVGGSAATRQPALVRELGADHVAAAATDAVAAAGRLVTRTSAPNPPLALLLAAVGHNVQELRTDRGWSQQKLAEAAALDRTYISTVERGRQNPSLAALLSLAQALEVPVTDLLAVEAGRAPTDATLETPGS